MMEKMNIWIIKENEFVNLLSGKARASRAAMLADYFIADGNEVIAWSSLWSHDSKTFLNDERTLIKIKKGLILHVLKAKIKYKKNVSLTRIFQGIEIGRLIRSDFEKMEKRPDLIYTCWPLIETSYEAVKFGKKNNIPVVIDIRDMWPDIFIQPFPSFLQPIINLFVNVLYKKKVVYAMKNATMVTGTFPKALSLAEKYGRSLSNIDHYVFHCYKKPNYPEKDILDGLRYWAEKFNVTSDTYNILLICSIRERVVNFDIVFDAIKEFENKNVKLIVCGTGPDFEDVSKKAKMCKNVIMAGLCNQLQLYSIAIISNIGLLPYYNHPDFVDSLPTKFSEYLSTSLVVFTSLKGLSKTILEENCCGGFFSSKEELVQLIAKFLSDSELLIKYRKNAEGLYNKKFNADKTYKAFVAELSSMDTNSRLK